MTDNTDLLQLEKLVFNNGERLVPYKIHLKDSQELVRHVRSYNFFKKVIDFDLKNKCKQNCNILDIGFGSGFGCNILSELDNVSITGIDIAEICKIYAEKTFNKINIKYVISDAKDFIKTMNEYQYIVSRGVLEHIDTGLDIIKYFKYSERIMIDVPYKEAEGNPYHVLLNITEENFKEFYEKEIFYEDQWGIIYDHNHKPKDTNMIMLVISKQHLQKVSNIINFPVS